VIGCESQTLHSELFETQAALEVNADNIWFRLSAIEFSEHLPKQLGFSTAGASNQNCVWSVANERLLNHLGFTEAKHDVQTTFRTFETI
jgi:hypothetical protein